MDKIRVLRDEIFTSTQPASPVAVPIGYTDVNLFAQAMQQEELRVQIMDGTFTPRFGSTCGGGIPVLWHDRDGSGTISRSLPPDGHRGIWSETLYDQMDASCVRHL